MKCSIRWGGQYGAPQNDRLLHPLLQDPRYAAALARTGALRPKNGLILINDAEAGLVQAMEARYLGGLIHGITLDRGPVWFAGFGGAHHVKAFFDEFNRLFPQRWGRRRRIIPEIADSPVARKMLESAGLERVGEGYQTYLLDLTRDLDDLRAGLAQKWRNVVNKAERTAGLTVEWDHQARQMPWFLKIYGQDKGRRGYAGPAPGFLDHLARLMTPSGDMVIGRAVQDGAAIAAVLIAIHGAGATYLAGWTGEAGRAAGAHHKLLWEALGMLQQRGIREFDLGGYNDADAATIGQFKQGMGGAPYRLAGRYR